MKTPAKILVGIFAAIGAVAVLAATAMAVMHYSMMGGFGC